MDFQVAGASSSGITASLTPGLRGEDVGTLEASSTSSIILVPGEPHFDLLFIKVHIFECPLWPRVWTGRRAFVSDPIQVPWALGFN